MSRALLILFLLGAAAGAGPEQTHTGRVKTKHFEIRFRPGSRAAASVDRTAVMAERDLESICAGLEIPVQGSFRLFLYDDVAELHVITGTEGNSGFSAVDASHIPYDNDQTRYHEMVHIVAYTLPKSGDEPRNLFFAEGLANALLEFVHGVHVHAVAAFYEQRGKLPRLQEMAGAPDFYAWQRAHGGFNAYDVAASWLRFLLDKYGAKKVKRYYTGMPARAAFGADVKKLEAEWRRLLKKRPLRPGLETLLRRRAGEPAPFEIYELDPDRRLPKEVLGKPKDWTDLTRESMKLAAAGRWARDDGGINGSSGTADWSWCELGKKKFKSCAIRARVVPAPGCVGVQLRLGEECQGMLTNAGAFVWKQGVVAMNRAEPLRSGRPLDLLVVRRGSQMQIWVDGFKIAEGKASADAARVGLGVAGGSATFQKVLVRPLRGRGR